MYFNISLTSFWRFIKKTYLSFQNFHRKSILLWKWKYFTQKYRAMFETSENKDMLKGCMWVEREEIFHKEFALVFVFTKLRYIKGERNLMILSKQDAKDWRGKHLGALVRLTE